MKSVNNTVASSNKELKSVNSGLNSPKLKRFLTFGFAGGLSVLSLGIAVSYGASIGAATGTATATLLISLGVLTEFGKALGFYSAASNLKSRSVTPAVGWSVVAVCCLAYSVTADLHVSATSRGDATAQRATATQTVKDARFDRETAAIALRSIESQGSFNERIAELLRTKGANRCLRIDGPISRGVCDRVGELKSDKALAAKREAELEAKISQANVLITANSGGVKGAADASADTLSAVFGKFGFDVQASDVALVLVFLPVLIIEFVGSLAWLLAGSIRVPVIASTKELELTGAEYAEKSATTGADNDPDNDGGQGVLTVQGSVVPLVKRGRKISGRNDIAARVLDTIKQQGGEFVGGVRKLADAIGGRRTTVHNAVKELVEAGALVQGRGRLVLA